MSWLLIDNSNTRTKFALGNESGLQTWRGVLATADVSPESIESLLAGVEFEAVIICSVVPAKAEILRQFFDGRYPLHFLDHRSPLGMAIDYPLPTQIGADRLANAAGVVSRHGAPAIVIDFGTATTFDVVSADGAYQGGVISPGINLSMDALYQAAAKLPRIAVEPPPGNLGAIGKGTVHAMQSGVFWGYVGLVEGLVARLSQEIVGPATVVATGGLATLFQRHTTAIAHVDGDLTIKGLIRLHQLNAKNPT
jgi:type III pantothenate kinase